MNPSIIIRNAEDRDLPAVLSLLESFRLPTEGVLENFSHFIVLEEQGVLVGTGGMEIFGKNGLIRSIAVDQHFQGKGYGRFLVQDLIEKADETNMVELFLLTVNAEDFFVEMGFQRISWNDVDEKVRQSDEFCFICSKTAVCMQLKRG